MQCYNFASRRSVDNRQTNQRYHSTDCPTIDYRGLRHTGRYLERWAGSAGQVRVPPIWHPIFAVFHFFSLHDCRLYLIHLPRLSTYIETLPPPASSNVLHSAPLSITQGDGASLSMSPLVAQSLPQYWLVESNGPDSYTISHLTSGQYLTYDKTTASSGQPRKVTLSGTSSTTWKISSQRMGGYAIVTATDSMAMCSLPGTTNINCQSFIPDSQTGYQKTQRWQLRRIGIIKIPGIWCIV